MHIELDSQPIDLDIEADDTREVVTDKTRNPNKFSFGKIMFTNGYLEAYTIKNTYNYPLIWRFNPSQNHLFTKGAFFVTDLRRIDEFRALITKIRYFQRLTLERKKNYVLLHSVSASYCNCSNTIEKVD
jgi:hypothetical protein